MADALGTIFLAASVPDPRRHASYFSTANAMQIRDAVCTLTEVVLPHGELVFGGHPAISPMVGAIASQLQRLDAVTIYQSEFFRAQIPATTLAYGQRIRWTSADPRGRDFSLSRMREAMIGNVAVAPGAAAPGAAAPGRAVSSPQRYSAGFFIGGMEGVEEEFELFRQLQPQAAFWPLASTGAAARLLFDAQRTEVLQQPAAPGLPQGQLPVLLDRELNYRRVIRQLLALA